MQPQVVVAIAPKVCRLVIDIRIQLLLPLPIHKELILHPDSLFQRLIPLFLSPTRLLILQSLLIYLYDAPGWLRETNKLPSLIHVRNRHITHLVTRNALFLRASHRPRPRRFIELNWSFTLEGLGYVSAMGHIIFSRPIPFSKLQLAPRRQPIVLDRMQLAFLIQEKWLIIYICDVGLIKMLMHVYMIPLLQLRQRWWRFFSILQAGKEILLLLLSIVKSDLRLSIGILIDIHSDDPCVLALQVTLLVSIQSGDLIFVPVLKVRTHISRYRGRALVRTAVYFLQALVLINQVFWQLLRLLQFPALPVLSVDRWNIPC